VRSCGPSLLEVGTAVTIDDGCTVIDGKVLFRLLGNTSNLGDKTTRWTASGKASAELHLVALADLENGTKLLSEEGFDDLAGVRARANVVQHEINTAASSKHHLRNSGEETTIRS